MDVNEDDVDYELRMHLNAWVSNGTDANGMEQKCKPMMEITWPLATDTGKYDTEYDYLEMTNDVDDEARNP